LPTPPTTYTLSLHDALPISEMSAENSISLVLLATRVAHAVGARPSVDMSPENISKAIGKSVKTVRNTLAMLGKTGIVERTNEGRSEEHTSELQSPCNLVCRL